MRRVWKSKVEQRTVIVVVIVFKVRGHKRDLSHDGLNAQWHDLLWLFLLLFVCGSRVVACEGSHTPNRQGSGGSPHVEGTVNEIYLDT